MLGDRIPVPHFVVFYNGKDHAQEHYTLRLSDAFEWETDASEIERVCHVYNKQCIRENILKDFLIEHRAEVAHVMTLDFTFEHRLELQREEAIEEGKKEALAGLIRNKMNNNKSLEQIAVDLDVPVDQIRPIYEELAKEMP